MPKCLEVSRCFELMTIEPTLDWRPFTGGMRLANGAILQQALLTIADETTHCLRLWLSGKRCQHFNKRGVQYLVCCSQCKSCVSYIIMYIMCWYCNVFYVSIGIHKRHLAGKDCKHSRQAQNQRVCDTGVTLLLETNLCRKFLKRWTHMESTVWMSIVLLAILAWIDDPVWGYDFLFKCLQVWIPLFNLETQMICILCPNLPSKL